MENMFCFQCEQTARSIACTGKAGVCGKTDTAKLQDKLTSALMGLHEQLLPTNQLMILIWLCLTGCLQPLLMLISMMRALRLL